MVLLIELLLLTFVLFYSSLVLHIKSRYVILIIIQFCSSDNNKNVDNFLSYFTLLSTFSILLHCLKCHDGFLFLEVPAIVLVFHVFINSIFKLLNY